MSNNSNLPDGWAMPDDLAKKVIKVLNNKSITPKDELADALDEMTRDIALIEAIQNNVKIIDFSPFLP